MFSKTPTAASDQTVKSEPNQQHWRLRESIGRYGTFIIIAGSVTIPVLLSLLVVLWGGKRGEAGELSSPEWRYIVLRGWMTESVTLLSAGIQICASLQSLICTSLAASTILETAGVPLSQLAEFSTMRGVNDGPWRLLYLSWTSSWRKMFAIQPVLVLMLYISTVATQFGSTLLVTDLDLVTLLAQPNQTQVNMTVPLSAFKIRPTPEQWFQPPQYNIFGEVPSTSDTTPTPGGLSDTGNIKRFFLPLSPENQTRTRSYDGPAYGWNSRVACVPPVVKGRFDTIDPGFRPFPFLLNVVANISYEESLARAGLQVPPLCADGRCLPPAFNCSVVTAGVAGREGITMCMPGLSNVADPKTMTHWSDGRKEPVNAHSMVVMVLRTRGMYKDWAFIRQGQQKSLPIHAEPTRNGEWADWSLNGGGVDFSLSMCFFSDIWEISHVKMSMAADPVVAKPKMAPGGVMYDTLALREQIGVTNKSLSITKRGLFAVESITNTTTRVNSTWWFDRGLFHQLGGNAAASTGANFSMFACTAGFGSATLNPFMDYTGMFEDVLLDTGRVSLSLHAVLGMRAQNNYYNMVPTFETAEAALVTESVLTQVPARWTGLLVFCGIMLLHFLSAIAITATFLLRTRYSKQGHFWHTISQVITEDTIPLLQHASESRDDHAMARSCLGSGGGGGGGRGDGGGAADDLDPVVVVARSTTTGRVQIIRRDELGRA